VSVAYYGEGSLPELPESTIDRHLPDLKPVPKRIALIGSAPSSVALAPYGDPSWTIWGCSPGAVPYAKRVDAWFEIHPLSQPDITPDYIAWMAHLGKPVHLIEPAAGIPTSVRYPREEMESKYGRYFFTSSIAWMFALALEQGPQEIGLWGVDMSATEEYGYQRAGCHYFIQIAQLRGIKVVIPPESDLAQPPQPYGFVMGNSMYKKLMARRTELQGRVQKAAENYEHYRNEWNFLKGALDDLEYTLNTWVQ
jgi:hypothetical protein